MNIKITEEYKASLVPFPKETLEPLKLPTETFVFLTETGLPLHAGYEITSNAPITFLSMPTIKKYPYLQHPYLQIGSLDVMGELAINLISISCRICHAPRQALHEQGGAVTGCG